MAPRLYPAGLDAFRSKFTAHDEALKTLCAKFGFIGLCLLDNAITPQVGGSAIAEEVYHQSIALVDLADAVLANVTDLRSHEPDSSMCFEIGYATTRGKNMWCYHMPATLFLAQVPNTNGNDADGWAVEDSDLPCNLIIAYSCRLVVGNVRAYLECMRVHYAQSRAGYVYADCFLQGDRGHPHSACIGWCLRRKAGA